MGFASWFLDSLTAQECNIRASVVSWLLGYFFLCFFVFGFLDSWVLDYLVSWFLFFFFTNVIDGLAVCISFVCCTLVPDGRLFLCVRSLRCCDSWFGGFGSSSMRSDWQSVQCSLVLICNHSPSGSVDRLQTICHVSVIKLGYLFVVVEVPPSPVFRTLLTNHTYHSVLVADCVQACPLLLIAC